MRCPYCQSEDTQVKDSRPAEDGGAIRRRRVCPVCGGRFTTFERVQLRDLIVVKRDGRKAAFERDKLRRSVKIALQKRPVSEDQIDQMVRDAESHAEEDRRRKEEADARNRADTLVYSTEKLLAEQGDKVGAEDKAAADTALVELNNALNVRENVESWCAERPGPGGAGGGESLAFMNEARMAVAIQGLGIFATRAFRAGDRIEHDTIAQCGSA